MKTIHLPLLGLAIALIGGVIYFGHQSFNSQPARASGPLMAALNEARAAGDRRTDLDLVFDAFIDNALPVADRLPLLEAEGFDCRIRRSELLPENSILSCQRPFAGFCEGYIYSVYEAANGEIFERSGTDYFVHENERSYSRCPAKSRSS